MLVRDTQDKTSKKHVFDLRERPNVGRQVLPDFFFNFLSCYCAMPFLASRLMGRCALCASMHSLISPHITFRRAISKFMHTTVRLVLNDRTTCVLDVNGLFFFLPFFRHLSLFYVRRKLYHQQHWRTMSERKLKKKSKKESLRCLLNASAGTRRPAHRSLHTISIINQRRNVNYK